MITCLSNVNKLPERLFEKLLHQPISETFETQQKSWKPQNFKSIFADIPSHEGIEGNERSDQAAKAVATNKNGKVLEPRW
jgi:hypothetical protein